MNRIPMIPSWRNNAPSCPSDLGERQRKSEHNLYSISPWMKTSLLQRLTKPKAVSGYYNHMSYPYQFSRAFNAPTTGEELPHSLGGHVTDADTLLRHKGLGEEAVYFMKEDARKFERLAKQLRSALNSGKLMSKEELKLAMEKRGIQVSEEGLQDLLRLKEHIKFSDVSGS